MSCTNSEKRALDLQNDNKTSIDKQSTCPRTLSQVEVLARSCKTQLKRCFEKWFCKREDYYDFASFTGLRLFTLENLKCLNVWYSPGASIYVYIFSKWLHTTSAFVTTTYKYL